jgi:transcriptional regulator with XRE-family HTH domain
MKNLLENANSIHIGNNIRRIREIMGIKQYTLAEECGWSQQQMSKLENSKTIQSDYLDLIAKKLGVTNNFIKSFNEKKAIYIIQHGITIKDSANNNYLGYQNINHPTDAFLEFFEKFIHDYDKKTQSLEEIGKAVLTLAEEVKKLKEGRH